MEEGICDNAGISLSKGAKRKQYSCCSWVCVCVCVCKRSGAVSNILGHKHFILPISQHVNLKQVFMANKPALLEPK